MPMHWSDDYEDEGELYSTWKGIRLPGPEEMDAICERACKAFNAACDKIDDQKKVDQLLRDILGRRTYEITGD